MSQEMNDNCCPLCFSRTSFFDINLNLRLLICENLECSYPFDKDIEGFFSEINNDNYNNDDPSLQLTTANVSASTTPIMTSNEITLLPETAQMEAQSSFIIAPAEINDMELNNLLLLNDPTTTMNTNILQDFSEFAEFAELFKEFPGSLASMSEETVENILNDQSNFDFSSFLLNNNNITDGGGVDGGGIIAEVAVANDDVITADSIVNGGGEVADQSQDLIAQLGFFFQ
ncbi:6905_t:CDS:2 [Entrophospora sp. SA101]|nr:15040_t:CDS:2 [Entrophospora sp. SA101]CAJ0864398.1 6905_t:CDS:2 [Entrophospora sp. SA101]